MNSEQQLELSESIVPDILNTSLIPVFSDSKEKVEDIEGYDTECQATTTYLNKWHNLGTRPKYKLFCRLQQSQIWCL